MVDADRQAHTAEQQVENIDVRATASKLLFPLEEQEIKDRTQDRELKKQDREQDRELKQGFVHKLFKLLLLQLFITNVFIYLTGEQWGAAEMLKLSPWTLDIFMVGTLINIFAVILVIAKNLFPQK